MPREGVEGRRHQTPSDAIRSYQKPSEAILLTSLTRSSASESPSPRNADASMSGAYHSIGSFACAVAARGHPKALGSTRKAFGRHSEGAGVGWWSHRKRAQSPAPLPPSLSQIRGNQKQSPALSPPSPL